MVFNEATTKACSIWGPGAVAYAVGVSFLRINSNWGQGYSSNPITSRAKHSCTGILLEHQPKFSHGSLVVRVEVQQGWDGYIVVLRFRWMLLRLLGEPAFR